MTKKDFETAVLDFAKAVTDAQETQSQLNTGLIIWLSLVSLMLGLLMSKAMGLI